MFEKYHTPERTFTFMLYNGQLRNAIKPYPPLMPEIDQVCGSDQAVLGRMKRSTKLSRVKTLKELKDASGLEYTRPALVAAYIRSSHAINSLASYAYYAKHIGTTRASCVFDYGLGIYDAVRSIEDSRFNSRQECEQFYHDFFAAELAQGARIPAHFIDSYVEHLAKEYEVIKGELAVDPTGHSAIDHRLTALIMGLIDGLPTRTYFYRKGADFATQAYGFMWPYSEGVAAEYQQMPKLV